MDGLAMDGLGIDGVIDVQWLIHTSFEAAVLAYTLTLACRLISPGPFSRFWHLFWLVLGLGFNGLSLVLRYGSFVPVMPLFQGPFFLPFFMGVFGLKSLVRNRQERSFLPAIIAAAAWAAYLFPNDFYLPYLQFKTPFAHLLFVFGIMGKAWFLLAGQTALSLLLLRSAEPGRKRSDLSRQMAFRLLWGFFFWTLSVFSGAVWSWLGWGSALVWDDPVIAISMATWLVYALLLHLHLTRFSGTRAKALFITAGAIWIICAGIVPELGPFRIPGWL